MKTYYIVDRGKAVAVDDKENTMRITLTVKKTRRAFDNVEMLIIDEKELCIWQPNIGNARGSRRTRLTREEVEGIVYVQTQLENENGKMAGKGIKD
jgi:hypothetical protein